MQHEIITIRFQKTYLTIDCILTFGARGDTQVARLKTMRFRITYNTKHIGRLVFICPRPRSSAQAINSLTTGPFTTIYRKISNVSGTKSQNLNDSRLVLHLSKPDVK